MSEVIGRQMMGRQATDPDPIDHPRHYTSHPSGVECIEIAEHLSFALGNALKYLWRAGQKDNAKDDVAKACWYLRRESERLYRDNPIGEPFSPIVETLVARVLTHENEKSAVGALLRLLDHEEPGVLESLADDIEDGDFR